MSSEAVCFWILFACAWGMYGVAMRWRANCLKAWGDLDAERARREELERRIGDLHAGTVGERFAASNAERVVVVEVVSVMAVDAESASGSGAGGKRWND